MRVNLNVVMKAKAKSINWTIDCLFKCIFCSILIYFLVDYNIKNILKNAILYLFTVSGFQFPLY